MPPTKLILLAAILCAPAAARANCARDVQDIAPRVQQIKDTSTKQRAQDYLQRAHRELDENDEFECQTAISVINKLLSPEPAPKP